MHKAIWQKRKVKRLETTNGIFLDLVGVNTKAKVLEIRGGWGIRQRLGQLGIHPGDTLIVKRSGVLGGPIVVNVHNADVALGRGMAKKVIVQPFQ